MTPEQQRIAIATARKWRIVQTTKYAWVVICPSNIERAWSSHDGVMNDKPASYYLPDYLGDLNAMHEAEKVLTAAQRITYADQLCILWTGSDDRAVPIWFWLTEATAAQRAQAFLRTLGLWQETPTQQQ
jgi:hypothetical protein